MYCMMKLEDWAREGLVRSYFDKKNLTYSFIQDSPLGNLVVFECADEAAAIDVYSQSQFAKRRFGVVPITGVNSFVEAKIACQGSLNFVADYTRKVSEKIASAAADSLLTNDGSNRPLQDRVGCMKFKLETHLFGPDKCVFDSSK